MSLDKTKVRGKTESIKVDFLLRQNNAMVSRSEKRMGRAIGSVEIRGGGETSNGQTEAGRTATNPSHRTIPGIRLILRPS